MGRLQFWLQGHPNKRRPWAAIWIGNRISDVRFYWWRLRGGKWPKSENVEPFVTIDTRFPSATTNFPIGKASNTGREQDG